MNRKEKKLAGSLWQSKYPNSFSKLPDLGPANACTERDPTHEGEAQRAQHGATTPGPRGHRRGAALTQHSENPSTEDAEHGAALEGGTSPAADAMQLGWKTGSAAE